MKILILLLISFLYTTPLQAKTFKISTDVPDGTFWMKQMRFAAKEIKKQTEGRVKFKFYPGGVMGSERIAMKKIRINQLQGAIVANGILANIYPDSQVYALPKLFNNIEEVNYIRDKFDSIIKKGIEDNGDIVSFGIIETGFAYILSTRKINEKGDLSSYKVWSPVGNKQIELTLNAIGITPIPLNVGDVLTGLQTNLIDTVIIPPVVAITLQWHTQVNYYSDVPLMYIYGTFIISKKEFNKISKVDQKIVKDIVSSVLNRIDEKNRKENISAFKALKQQGIKDSSPKNNMLEHWEQKGVDAMILIKKKNIMSDNMINEVIEELNKYRSSKGM